MNPATQCIPRTNANDDEVELVFWYVEDGEWIEAGQDLFDLETMKAAVTVQAEASGYVQRLKEARETIRVGEPAAKLWAQREQALVPAEVPVANASSESASGPRFSQEASRLIQSAGLDPSVFKGLALVTASQVRGFLEEQSSGFRKDRVVGSKAAEIQSLSALEGVLRSSLTVQIPSLKLREWLSEQGYEPSRLLPVVLFEIVQALAGQDRCTAFFENNHIHYYDRLHLGVALDLGKGLKVVRLADADRHTLADLMSALDEKVAGYLENSLAVEDLTGSTVTVTDLSAMNILQFEPILNGKQSMIFAVGGDQGLEGKPLTLTASFDHRVLTGREVAVVLGRIRDCLSAYKPALQVPATEGMPIFEACDRCGIGTEEYYQLHKRDGLMQVYVRPEGDLGALCHVCAKGF